MGTTQQEGQSQRSRIVLGHDDAGVDAHPTASWQGVQCGSSRLTRVRGVPLASEALRFAEIVRGHPACNVVATPDGVLSRLTGQS